ncbi:serine protease [Chlorella sorokiniana]|uniref:Serine protease n=1 Tax=Chlorella sorokiniana TaxID=3076 RepID=A0A2P6U0D7_CHLSO|nr:serine protease [Chlorella sorokiniana]|eukprot:PRW59779.1 serine protease [Chlorella sorokiniana]
MKTCTALLLALAVGTALLGFAAADAPAAPAIPPELARALDQNPESQEELMALLAAGQSEQVPDLGRKADPAAGGHRRALLACTTCNQFTALWKCWINYPCRGASMGYCKHGCCACS